MNTVRLWKVPDGEPHENLGSFELSWDHELIHFSSQENGAKLILPWDSVFSLSLGRSEDDSADLLRLSCDLELRPEGEIAGEPSSAVYLLGPESESPSAEDLLLAMEKALGEVEQASLRSEEEEKEDEEPLDEEEAEPCEDDPRVAGLFGSLSGEQEDGFDDLPRKLL